MPSDDVIERIKEYLISQRAISEGSRITELGRLGEYEKKYLGPVLEILLEQGSSCRSVLVEFFAKRGELSRTDYDFLIYNPAYIHLDSSEASNLAAGRPPRFDFQLYCVKLTDDQKEIVEAVKIHVRFDISVPFALSTDTATFDEFRTKNKLLYLTNMEFLKRLCRCLRY